MAAPVESVQRRMCMIANLGKGPQDDACMLGVCQGCILAFAGFCMPFVICSIFSSQHPGCWLLSSLSP